MHWKHAKSLQEFNELFDIDAPITLPPAVNRSKDPIGHIPGSTKMMDHIVGAGKKVVESVEIMPK